MRAHHVENAIVRTNHRRVMHRYIVVINLIWIDGRCLPAMNRRGCRLCAVIGGRGFGRTPAAATRGQRRGGACVQDEFRLFHRCLPSFFELLWCYLIGCRCPLYFCLIIRSSCFVNCEAMASRGAEKSGGPGTKMV